jgi:hypothetical protein
VLVEGWQLAVTFVAPGGTFGICAGGVLGEALTVIVTFWGRTPGCVAGVYVTVHGSADATGISAMHIAPRTKPTVMTAIFSLWLLNTLGYLLPPRACTAPILRGGRAGTLTVGSVLCKVEPSDESAVLRMPRSLVVEFIAASVSRLRPRPAATPHDQCHGEQGHELWPVAYVVRTSLHNWSVGGPVTPLDVVVRPGS